MYSILMMRSIMLPESSLLSIAMLKEVITGKTYDALAAQYCVSRTAVERCIKTMVRKLSREVGIDGVNADGIVFVRRLSNRSEASMTALER